MEPPIRVVHDRYEVGELLGEGGDATVYQAHDRHLGRTVAIKFLRPALHVDSTFLQRFEREARAAARLDHPHIVPVYDYGEQNGQYYLVMQYLPGGDLRALLADGQPLALDLALRLATEVADALAAAHARGIVHRDVKPANILLTADDHAKVTDFGIAKMLDVPALTATAAMVGSAQYMAPEQANAGPITPAADVYSLGLVLYEMLAGRRPFEGTTFVQVVMQHLHATPPPLDQLNPAVPPTVAEVVAWALAKDAAARFPDGAAFAVALRELRAAPTAAPPSAPPAVDDRAVAAAAFARPAPPGAAEPRPAESHRTWGDDAPAPTPVAPAPAPWSAPTGPPAPLTGPAPTTAEPMAVTQTIPGLPLAPPADAAAGAPRRQRPVGRRHDPRDPSLLPVALVLGLGLLTLLYLVGSGLLGRGVTGGDRGAATASGRAVASATPTGEVAGRNVAPEAAAGEGPTASETAAPTTGPTQAAAAAPTAAATTAPTAAPTATTAPTAASTAAPTASAAAAAPADAPAAPAEAPAAPAAARGRVVLDDDAFQGGFSAPRSYRGRTARWLYGALSPHGEMTATFNVDGTPGAGELVISGIDSENGPQTPIAVVLNDTVVFSGGNPLPKDHWRSDVAPWGTATIAIPAGVLKAGRNTLTFKNLVQTNNYNAPPYFMLDQATITY